VRMVRVPPPTQTPTNKRRLSRHRFWSDFSARDAGPSAHRFHGHIWPLNREDAVLILPSLVHHRYTQVRWPVTGTSVTGYSLIAPHFGTKLGAQDRSLGGVCPGSGRGPVMPWAGTARPGRLVGLPGRLSIVAVAGSTRRLDDRLPRCLGAPAFRSSGPVADRRCAGSWRG
jgi:hypothetical protein